MHVLRPNTTLDWWGPGNYYVRVIPPTCPQALTFDNGSHLFSSSCPIFDLGVDNGFSFDSSNHLFSSAIDTLNEATFDEDS